MIPERQRWVENVLNIGRKPHPYEIASFQINESAKPIRGRIEVYTGHGLQRVGNGKDLWEAYPDVRYLYRVSANVAGFDVAGMSFEGPKEELNRTEYAQVVNGTFNAACKIALEIDRPNSFARYPRVAAGQSAGAFSAAYDLGCFGDPNEIKSFERHIEILRERGKIMQSVSDEVQGGLLVVGTVKGKKDDVSTEEQRRIIRRIADEVATQNGLSVALDVSEEQVILAGRNADMSSFTKVISQQYGGERGVRAIRSEASSGPFHSNLMESAEEPIRDLLRDRIDDARGLYVANTQKRFLTDGREIEGDLGNLTTQKVAGRDMDDLIYESCRGTIVFIGGKNTVAEGMFLRSAGDKSTILSKRNIAIASAIAGGTGAILATRALRRKQKK